MHHVCDFIFRWVFSSAFTGGVWYIFAKVKGFKPKQLEVINVINGVVLPDPDDPRWYPNGISKTNGFYYLGNIRVYVDKIVFYQDGHDEQNYSWINIQYPNPYVEAIKLAFRSRIAEDSILNAKMLPKRKKAKPKAIGAVKDEFTTQELVRIVHAEALTTTSGSK